MPSRKPPVNLTGIVNLQRYPISDELFALESKKTLDEQGVLVLPEFLQPDALDTILEQAREQQSEAYYCAQNHSVYLTPSDPKFTPDHPINRTVESSKGCICHDKIDLSSPLQILYKNEIFQEFVKQTTGQDTLYAYADPLSSINVHYANKGQQLGWHFDNSSFAITLLLQKPDAGGRFEYLKDVRKEDMTPDETESSYKMVAKVLDGCVQPKILSMNPGTLVLFRGRNSIHRVSPNESDETRILAVLAYNAEPDVELSESARMTFFGRLR